MSSCSVKILIFFKKKNFFFRDVNHFIYCLACNFSSIISYLRRLFYLFADNEKETKPLRETFEKVYRSKAAQK